VRDNGAGIAADRVQDSGRFGLVGMRDRLQALGGTLAVGLAQNAGTEVCAHIPLKES
jgi:two-component system sensor histidine kinase UhpB